LIEELCRGCCFDRTSQSFDFTTVHWAHLPYTLPDECSRRIVIEVKGVSRVVYNISGKRPAMLEWEWLEE
jgi:GMP synthase (glutamine-hydrolysing)